LGVPRWRNLLETSVVSPATSSFVVCQSVVRGRALGMVGPVIHREG
jgi:hypothetical protein